MDLNDAHEKIAAMKGELTALNTMVTSLVAGLSDD